MTSEAWRLKRTNQCVKCPWRIGVDPRDIPRGYSVDKHRALISTIAVPGDLSPSAFDRPSMACHEDDDAHCIGWLKNQIGEGNNLPLRIRMMSCENAREITLRGPQHENFSDTLPADSQGDIPPA